MEQKSHIMKISFVIVSLIMISACSSNQKKQEVTIESTIDISIEESALNKFDDSFHPPSPDEVMSFFEVSDIKYNPNLLNRVENASNYFDSRSQALNLGIYLSDVAYLNLYEQSTNVVHYMQTIFVLSEKLNISSAFNDDMVSRLMSNISNHDSTLYFTEQIYFSLVEYLTNNDRKTVLSLISIGSYIEILHLAIESIDKYDPENTMLEQVEDLNILLEGIYLFAEKNASDPNVAQSFNDLKAINSIIESATSVSTDTEISNDAANKMVISGGSNLELSEESFLKLKTEVNKIRNRITQ